jgi:sec-independent protein translocase protein TatC
MKTKKPQQQKTSSKPLQKTSKQTSNATARLTFVDHIRELRRRILWVGIVFGVVSTLAYNYNAVLVKVVMAPLHGQKLIYLTPAGGFSFIFSISLYAGLIVSAPMLIYQLYSFIRPTLPHHAQQSTVKIATLATALMFVGVGYGYFVAVPTALGFLSTFAGSNVAPSLTADSYLHFFLGYIAGLAAVAELPLLLIFWHWIHPMTPGGLLKSERYIILFAFIIAAVIAPTPDVYNQTMVAVPLIVLYQVGIGTVFVSIMRQRRQAKLMDTEKAAVTPAVTMPLRQQPSSVTLPVIQPLSQAATNKKPVVHMTTVRSMDGFRISSASRASKVYRPTQSLVVPERPLAVRRPATLRRRSPMRIDGMSPM